MAAPRERLDPEERRTIYARVFDEDFDERWVALVASLAQSEGDVGDRAADVRGVLNAAVDQSILLAAPLTGSALHHRADVQARAPGAVVLGMQRDVRGQATAGSWVTLPRLAPAADRHDVGDLPAS